MPNSTFYGYKLQKIPIVSSWFHFITITKSKAYGIYPFKNIRQQTSNCLLSDKKVVYLIQIRLTLSIKPKTKIKPWQTTQKKRHLNRTFLVIHKKGWKHFSKIYRIHFIPEKTTEPFNAFSILTLSQNYSTPINRS